MPGYDLSLPSLPPFMYVEDKRKVGNLAVIAFGAYNAMGLIGPEKGGIAIVHEPPKAFVIATLDIPYDPRSRAGEFKRILASKILKKEPQEIVRRLSEEGYEVRT